MLRFPPFVDLELAYDKKKPKYLSGEMIYTGTGNLMAMKAVATPAVSYAAADIFPRRLLV